MNKNEMIAKLQREDLKGVGVKATFPNDIIIYYFYEDFGHNKGIIRASKHFEDLINKGKCKKAEYFYKDDCFKNIPCCGCGNYETCTKRKANL